LQRTLEMDTKKPDNFAENKALLPYGDNVGAPIIKLENVSTWKEANLKKVNHQLQAKYLELQQESNKLLLDYMWNEFIYNAKFAYEPIIGQTYHLYSNELGEGFLSIIAPNEWDQLYIGSFKLDSNSKWSEIKQI